MVGVVEHTAGFLYVDRCVQAQLDEARRLGAVLRDNEPALAWQPSPGGVTVRTATADYHAAKLLVTAGPWARQALGSHGAGLTVMRQVVLWFAAPNAALFRRDHFPIFIAGTPGGHFYGLPALDERGVKLGQHYSADELSGPEGVSRTVTADDEDRVRSFVRAICRRPTLPAGTPPSVCTR